ncbi:hypothetical protein AB1Y20_019743 [Prymnesium parvum]|uniref:ShKT domain-containing protein n=1 Tax=Prymnesium parvum TaxID=97485 RepID=A0AB34JUZ1_PRYPA
MRALLLVLLVLLAGLGVEAKRKKGKTSKRPGRAVEELSAPLLILVDDIDDRIANASSSEPSSFESNCSTVTASGSARPDVPELPPGASGCTLRSALEMANAIGGGAKVRIVLRPGRFRLRARLPEVTGAIEVVGAPGRRKPRPKPAPLKAAVGEKELKRLEAKRADEWDDVDLHFQKEPTGQSRPIGTVIDAGQAFQHFRTAAGSELRLQDVRLEEGRAMGGSDDPRAAVGGAISALGKVVLENVVVRKNRAINGGAIYTEAPLDARDSLFEYNFAEECGGMMYAAAFGGARTISACKIHVNQEASCTRRPAEPADEPRARPKGGSAVGKVAATKSAGKTVFAFDDDDDDDDEAPPPPPPRAAAEPDTRGAIFEGPRLCEPPPPPPKKGGAKRAEPEGRRRAAAGGERYDPREGVKRQPQEGVKRQPREPPPPQAPPPRPPPRRTAVDAVFEELERIAELPDSDDDDDDDDENERDADFDEDDFDDDDDGEEWSARAGGRRRRRPRRREPPAPPEPPKECHPEKHGGETGGVHELSCVPGWWRRGRRQPTECLIWRSTSNCSGIDGDRNPAKDKDCYAFIPDGESGYCECAGGREAAHSDCSHEPFTCEQECRKMREARRRRKNAERRERGEPVPPPPPPPPPLYAIGAFGGAGSGRTGLLDGLGLYCSDGSWTSIAGSPPSRESRWEFVCPGWEVCRDANETCADWAKRGECVKNPAYMTAHCMQSCNACPELKVPAEAQGLVALDVRAGKMVDALRLQCAPPEPEAADAEDDDEEAAEAPREGGKVYTMAPDGATRLEEELVLDEMGEPVAEKRKRPRNPNITASEWFGGKGGYECELACSSENHTEGWRVGGFITSLTVAAGQRVDRIELTKCSKDVDI